MAGDGLNIHAEDAVLNQVQLSTEVRIPIALEGFVDFDELLSPRHVIFRVKRNLCPL